MFCSVKFMKDMEEEVGLKFNFTNTKRRVPNTMAAHVLIQYTGEIKGPEVQAQMADTLYKVNLSWQ